MKVQAEDLQGRINIAYQQLEIEESRSRALGFKLKRYGALAILTEKLNQNLSLGDTLKTLVDEAYLLLGQKKSLCAVYLIDTSTALSVNGERSRTIDSASGALSLAQARDSSDDTPIIKQKQGDMFDQWALRHVQPLLVEDTSSDFRFDLEKFRKTSERRIDSLISCCLVSQNRPIGLVRFDSPYPNVFNLEDLRLLSAIADIASVALDNAQYYQHMRELAIKDSLTGLYTRKFTIERLDQEIGRCLITSTPLSIMMLDIDFFKKYNDLYGHLAGDMVLRSLAASLGGYLKGRDSIIGRLGGEEFLVILPSTSKQEAFSLAENIRGGIQEKTLSIRRKPSSITVSIGIANFPQDANLPGDLLNKADIALYEAKKTSRNRVCLF